MSTIAAVISLCIVGTDMILAIFVLWTQTRRVTSPPPAPSDDRSLWRILRVRSWAFLLTGLLLLAVSVDAVWAVSCATPAWNASGCSDGTLNIIWRIGQPLLLGGAACMALAFVCEFLRRHVLRRTRGA